MPFNRIGIVGVGLLGGSIGLAVKAALKHCAVIGYDNRTPTLDRGKRVGAIDVAAESLEQLAGESDLLILCTPVSVFEGVLKQISTNTSPVAVVTDVGSTKGSVVDLAGRLLPHPRQFIGSHPMAGGEKGGIENARVDLLKDAVCILTPVGTSPVVEVVEEFWKSLGMRVSRLSPAEHDQIMAEVSHLPHAVAGALVRLQNVMGMSLCGPGFRDVTRIASGNPELWRDIFLDNKMNLLSGISRFRTELGRFEQILVNGDREELRKWLAAAAERRNSI
ncbi:MAG TPA: prephenate dehydrogenase [Tepidisphaeraceae bacterium]|nr:prephenate dehydrogenase [Tepidisphaeraceae bacterium]